MLEAGEVARDPSKRALVTIPEAKSHPMGMKFFANQVRKVCGG
jgi:hypothetical protein